MKIFRFSFLLRPILSRVVSEKDKICCLVPSSGVEHCYYPSLDTFLNLASQQQHFIELCCSLSIVEHTSQSSMKPLCETDMNRSVDLFMIPALIAWFSG